MKPVPASEIQAEGVPLTEAQLAKRAAEERRRKREAKMEALGMLGVERPTGSADLAARLEARATATSRAVTSGWRARKVVRSRLSE